MSQHYIVMADIVKSGSYDERELGENFSRIVSLCNKKCASQLLSPNTITLGDEFQGIAASLKSSVDILFCLEETLLAEKFPFKLRYVVHYGEIETDINRSVAYGMMGAGLTFARERLTEKKRSRPRFNFIVNKSSTDVSLNKLFRLVELLSNYWRPVDCDLIQELLLTDNNFDVAEKLGKDRSLIWRRRRHLRIEEYQILKELIYTEL